MASDWTPPPAGEIQDAGGSRFEALVQEWAREALRNGSEWPKVSAYVGTGCLRWMPASLEKTWYQTSEEGRILSDQAEELTSGVKPNAVIFDYGSANCTKVTPLLDCLEKRKVDCHYICVDVSRPALVQGMLTLNNMYKHIKVSAIWGTFDDAKEEVLKVQNQRVIWAMGSTLAIGGHLNEAIASWYKDLLREDDIIYAGQDCAGQDRREKVLAAYNTETFHNFIEAGIKWIDDQLGLPGSWSERWSWDHEWLPYGSGHCHTMLIKAKKPIEWEGNFIPEGSVRRYFSSWKYDPLYIRRIFKARGMIAIPKQPSGNCNCKYIICNS